MNRERWHRIREIFFEAELIEDPQERKALVEERCTGDPALRQEIESLLDQLQRSSFLNLFANLTGQQIGLYEIGEFLGSGAVGFVYKARDTDLGRLAALKILQPLLVIEPEYRRRFLREAKCIAALNHPNIVTVYGILRYQGTDVIAMEFVPGKTLDQVIPRRGMPPDQAVRYALQIVEGLRKAHQAGVIHRDLKPANILVREDQLLKLVDFGLARDKRDLFSESLQMPRTQHGTIMGTVGYMSPEQARGAPADARSDIFSVGVVLYEMTAGRRAFQRDLDFETLHAILHENPPALSKDVPDCLKHIVMRCLQKVPGARYQSMGELAADLRSALAQITASAALQNPDKTPPLKRRWMKRIEDEVKRSAALSVAAGCAVIPFIALGLRLSFHSSAAANGVPLLGGDSVPVTSSLGYTARPALSVDGNLIAFVSDHERPGQSPQLYLHHIEGSHLLEGRQLTTNAVELTSATISPDNTRVVFSAILEDKQGIYEVGALGGVPQLLTANAHAPRYSPDGKWLAYLASPVGSATSQLVVTRCDSATTATIPQFYDVRAAIWSPDSKYLLMQAMRSAPQGFINDDVTPEWWVLPLGTTTATPLGAVAMERRMQFSPTDPATEVAAWLPDDHLVFSTHKGDSTNIWWIRLARHPWSLQNDPQALTAQSGTAAMPTIAGNRMIFATAERSTSLYGLPANLNQGTGFGPLERPPHDIDTELQFSISSDGNWWVYASSENGNYDLYLRDLRPGSPSLERKLTATPDSAYHTIITPDGAKVAYQIGADQKRAVHIINADGTGERVVCDNCGCPRSWHPDLTKILLWRDLPPADRIAVLDVPSGRAVDILQEPELSLGAPVFSPDGGWISFGILPAPPASRFEDRFDVETRIFVAPFHGMTRVEQKDWIAITPKGRTISSNAFWSPDGNTLYYFTTMAQHDVLWAQRLDPVTKYPVGKPKRVYYIPSPLKLFHTVLGNTITVLSDSIILALEDSRTANLQTLQLRLAPH